jgi:ABC-type amino acid transport substrate-binding protein
MDIFKGGNTVLRDVIIATLSDMMVDGTYKEILEHWGVAAGAISKPLR